MSIDANLALAHRAVRAFHDGDVPALLELVTEDLELFHPMTQAVWPWAGYQHGKTGFLRFLSGMGAVAEFERFEATRYLASGDEVVVFLAERLRIRATGRVVDHEYIHRATIRDGRIARLAIYEDTAPIIAAVRDLEAI